LALESSHDYKLDAVYVEARLVAESLVDSYSLLGVECLADWLVAEFLVDSCFWLVAVSLALSIPLALVF